MSRTGEDFPRREAGAVRGRGDRGDAIRVEEQDEVAARLSTSYRLVYTLVVKDRLNSGVGGGGASSSSAAAGSRTPGRRTRRTTHQQAVAAAAATVNANGKRSCPWAAESDDDYSYADEDSESD